MSQVPNPSHPPGAPQFPSSIQDAGPRTPDSFSPLPTAEVVPARRPALVWIIPLLALIVAGFLIYQAQSQRGRVVRIRFDIGGGIKADDPLMYRGMRVGRVRDVSLARDLSGVVVTAELSPDASALAVEGSKFWIVHPVVSFSRVSGLETLLGPKFVEVEPGPDPAAARTEFTGLEREPVTTGSQHAKSSRSTSANHAGELTLTLRSGARTTVNIGSPILYRGIKVGSIIAFDLSETGQFVDMTGVVEGRYAHLVRSNSSFFSASGVDLAVGLSGLALRAPSLESVLSGGIEFATPNKPGTPVENGTSFNVEKDPPKGALEWSPDLSERAAGENAG